MLLCYMFRSVNATNIILTSGKYVNFKIQYSIYECQNCQCINFTISLNEAIAFYTLFHNLYPIHFDVFLYLD